MFNLGNFMRFLMPLLAVPFVTGGTRSADPPTDVPKTLDRGLQFLATDALAWKKKHNCVSCHHAALVIWALREGKHRGHAVDEPTLTELTKWAAASGDGSNLMRKPPEKYRDLKVVNVYTVLLALAFEAGGAPTDDLRDALMALRTKIKADQTKDGAWEIWPEPGPKLPICGASAEVMSTLATLALLPDAGGKASRDKSLPWLAARTPEDDAQADALRLLLWLRAGRPAEQSQALAKRIRGRQNGDGGWSQTKERASDAFATGQALYALMESGLPPGDPAIQKAQVFLAKSQRPDGSWEVITRASLDGKLTPNVPINGAGSAWATLGLMRTLPDKNAPKPAQEPGPKDKKVVPIQEEMLERERLLSRQFAEVLESFLRLQQRWKRSDHQEDRDRAVVMTKLLDKAHEDLLRVQFEQIVEILRAPPLKSVAAIKPAAERAQKIAQGLSTLSAMVPESWRSEIVPAPVQRILDAGCDQLEKAERRVRDAQRDLKEQIDKLDQPNSNLELVVVRLHDARRNLADSRERLETTLKDLKGIVGAPDSKKEPKARREDLQTRILMPLSQLLDAKGPIAMAEAAVRDLHEALDRDVEKKMAAAKRKQHLQAARACGNDVDRLLEKVSAAFGLLTDFDRQSRALDQLVRLHQDQKQCADRLQQWHEQEVRRVLKELLEENKESKK